METSALAAHIADQSRHQPRFIVAVAGPPGAGTMAGGWGLGAWLGLGLGRGAEGLGAGTMAGAEGLGLWLGLGLGLRG